MVLYAMRIMNASQAAVAASSHSLTIAACPFWAITAQDVIQLEDIHQDIKKMESLSMQLTMRTFIRKRLWPNTLVIESTSQAILAIFRTLSPS